MLRSLVLSLSGAQLSDLFFNYDHPHRDALYKERDPKRGGDVIFCVDWDAEWAAVREDAAEFCLVIGVVDQQAKDLADELADDFMKRR